MAGYGYIYRSFSTYSTVKNEPRGPVAKPFSPSVPKTNGNPVSDGYVTKKTIVPVTSRPYGDDYNSHNSPSRGDHDEWHPQTNPIRGSPRKVDHEFPTKVQSEASRPQRSSPVASTDWPRHTPQPTPYSAGDYGSSKEGRKPIGGTIRNENHDGNYNGPNGYGDYGSNNKGRKPIGSTIGNDDYDDYNGTNGYGGDYGSNKEGRKPTGGTIRNDGYNNGTNGYGGYYGGNKEGHKPIGSPIRYDNYDGTNGYGDYGSNKGHKPIGSPIRNDNYDGTNGYGSNKDGTRKPIVGTNHDGYNYNGTNGYGDKEGRKPIGSPAKNDNYDGPKGYGGYGDYNKKEGYKPTSLPIRDGNHDGYNNGYGIGKEQHRPFGTATRNDNSDDDRDDYGNYNNRPKISSAWTAAPRKGTQLSEPTQDIEKALELLRKEAAKHEHSNNYDSPSPSGSPKSCSSVPVEPAMPTKDNYGGETIDRRDAAATTRHLSSRPSTGVTVIDGRGADYRGGAWRRNGNKPIIDSVEAEKRFKGMRLW